jgi:hypothetical protein
MREFRESDLAATIPEAYRVEGEPRVEAFEVVSVLRSEEPVAPGFGIYYIWYFAGSAFLPVVGGYLKDITGTAASSVLFGVAMMIATLTLAGLFRLTQACIPVRAGSRG